MYRAQPLVQPLGMRRRLFRVDSGPFGAAGVALCRKKPAGLFSLPERSRFRVSGAMPVLRW